jgi:hypothetical protein
LLPVNEIKRNLERGDVCMDVRNDCQLHRGRCSIKVCSFPELSKLETTGDEPRQGKN